MINRDNEKSSRFGTPSAFVSNEEAHKQGFLSFRKLIPILSLLILFVLILILFIYFPFVQSNRQESEIASDEISEVSYLISELPERFSQDGYEATIDYFMKQVANMAEKDKKASAYLTLSKIINETYGEKRLDEAILYSRVSDNFSSSGESACFVLYLTTQYSLDGFEDYSSKCKKMLPQSNPDEEQNEKKGFG